MEFLTKHLWDIFAVGKEENTDGDSLHVDMATAVNMYIECLSGNPEHDYKCVPVADRAALYKEWCNCNQDKAQREYSALVNAVPGLRHADRYKELCAAFNANDRKAFDAAVADGLSALYRAEGVDA